MPEPVPTPVLCPDPRGFPDSRPVIAGKYFELDGRRFEPRGVTYGTFARGSHGDLFPEREVVVGDLDAIRAAGFNCIRTYTPPPIWLLDAAYERGIHTLVGLPWQQHMALLDDPPAVDRTLRSVREQVAAFAGHPGVFAAAVGNEIPASIVRWSGRRRIEPFLERLCDAVRAEDPGLLVTYANYPTTEYLRLPFLDFVSFNVYLESIEDLSAYVARLHNQAGDRPLVMAELGVDSIRNGLCGQARMVSDQLRASLEGGCAGTFVFSWTDEWHRGGVPVTDWAFGLTDASRRPKPSLTATRRVIEAHPAPPAEGWPTISVVVCAYQANETIEACLRGLGRLRYPDFEVVLIDDGSTDGTGPRAERVASELRARSAHPFDFRMIRTSNRGLSHARNRGISEARGEIVAFLDADAWPEDRWLHQLAYAFASGEHAGVGGPNVAPRSSGTVGSCVAQAPGGPVHILETDRIAEHVPGCNMAFRRECLEAIGGFDPQFRVAGDDVDLCWRIQEAGWTIGFSPGAMVWHEPRPTIRGYWRQQVGYGRAEALLEAKWPQKYNTIGHVTWGGRIYGPGMVPLPWKRGRVYGGTWGRAPFQREEEAPSGGLWDASAMPEWYLTTLALGGLSILGIFWPPLAIAWLGLTVGLAVPVARSLAGGRAARFSGGPLSTRERIRRRTICAALHLVQPLARLEGRLLSGLVPWRSRANVRRFSVPRVIRVAFWREDDVTPPAVLEALVTRLTKRGAHVHRDSGWDDWDLQVEGGAGGGARLRSCVEWHGAAKQVQRYAVVPRISPFIWWSVSIASLLAVWSATDGAEWVALVLATFSAVLAGRAIWECGIANRTLSEALFDAMDGPTTVPLGTAPTTFEPAASLDPEPPPDLRSIVDAPGARRLHPAPSEAPALEVATR